MSSSWRSAAGALAADLGQVFAERLRSVVAYGPALDGASDAPLTCLALVDSLTINDLEACARHAHGWERQHLATPLILPVEEFRRSLDAFPLEYGEIVRSHDRVFGTDPFENASISREDLRRACETQIKSHLVHLREGFMEAGGRPQAIAALVTASAPAFAALLRHVAWLAGSNTSGRPDAAREGAQAAGLSETVVGSILSLNGSSAFPTTDAARLFPGYLAAVEQLARSIDTWRA